MNSSQRRRLRATIAILMIGAALAVFVVFQIVMAERISPSVTVAGIDLGGMSADAAESALESDLWPRISLVQLETDEKEPLTLSLAQLGISLDTTATAAAAVLRGRHELPLGLSVWLPGSGGDVAPILKIDASALEQGLMGVRELVDVAACDARLTIDKSGIEVVPSIDGRAVDATALTRAIAASAREGSAYVGPVPMLAVSPRVTTAVAESRAGAAVAYLSRPIILRHAAQSIELTPRTTAGILTVNLAADADKHPLTFHNDRARKELRRLLSWAERPPVDARIIVHPKGGITVMESRDGEVLDWELLLDDLDAAAVGGGLRTVVVSTSPAAPKLSSDDVRNMGLSSLGSQFTTYFDPGNAARASNLALAAKLVDGTVIDPGRTFSLNAAMGPRTVNRGFDYAPVIAADGVLRQGVGGGICQYATTLFNAALFAGLPVVDRQAHSLYISHYPIGRDATVAWGSVDLRFRNDTANKLLIRSWVEGDALKVAIVGKTGRTVTLKTTRFYDVRKPAHGQSDPRVIYDADLGPGVVRWEQGIDGRTVKVERTVRRGDGTLIFRDNFVSRYEPLDWVKRVGTN
ncbi:MAG TPA: VanW family protein [Thermoleophilia bacterium]|nr:VanW family protein [Thermoleophilia bacterium]